MPAVVATSQLLDKLQLACCSQLLDKLQLSPAASAPPLPRPRAGRRAGARRRTVFFLFLALTEVVYSSSRPMVACSFPGFSGFLRRRKG